MKAVTVSDVAGKLQRHQPGRTVDVAQRDRVDHAQAVGQPDEEEERVDGQRAWGVDLEDHRRAQQQRADDDAAMPISQTSRRRLSEVMRPARTFDQVSLLIMSKMGMYIATTMPPTITPRNAIITGSINVSMPATAVSTSSS